MTSNARSLSLRCGVTTKKGTPCRLLAAECEWHQGTQPAAPVEQRSATAPASVPTLELPPTELRDLQWWVIRMLASGSIEPPRAQAITAAARILASLGPAPQELMDAARETALRGRVMHGLAPRDPEQWVLAATLYDDEALEEFRRWEREEEDDSDPGEAEAHW